MKKVQDGNSYSVVAFVPGVPEVAAAAWHRVAVFGVPDLRPLRTFEVRPPPSVGPGDVPGPGAIQAMAFRPGDRHVAVSLVHPSSFGEAVQEGVFVCDGTTGACLRAFPGHTGVHDLRWDPRGRYLAGVGEGRLLLWDARADAVVVDLPHGGGPGSIGFSPDGARFVAAPKGEAPFVLDLASGRRVALPAALAALGPTSLQWTSPDTLLAVADGRVHLWDVGATRATRTLRLDQAPDACSPPDATRPAAGLAWGWEAGGVTLWPLAARGEVVRVPDAAFTGGEPADGDVTGADVDDAGEWLAAVADGDLVLLPIAEARALGEADADDADALPLPAPPPPAVPNVEAGSGLRAIATFEPPRVVLGEVRAAFGAGLLAVGGEVVVLRRCEPPGVERTVAPGHDCADLAFHPTEPLLAVATVSGGGGIVLVDTRTGKKRPVSTRSPVSRLAWSPDGRFLVLAGKHGALVRDTTLGKDVFEERGAVARISFSPDGTRLAFDRKVLDLSRRWAPVPLAEAFRARPVLAGDQDRLLSATQVLQATAEGAVVRDLSTGETLAAVSFAADAPPTLAATRDLPPSERWRALVTHEAPNRTWRLWDLATGDRLAEATRAPQTRGWTPPFTVSPSAGHVLAYDGLRFHLFARAAVG